MHTMLAAVVILFLSMGDAHALLLQPEVGPPESLAGFTVDSGSDPTRVFVSTEWSTVTGDPRPSPSGDPMWVIAAGDLTTTMTGTFDAVPGNLEFWFNFLNYELISTTTNDSASVVVNGTPYLLADSIGVGLFGESGWTEFVLPITTAGPLDISFEVANDRRDGNSSYLLVDSISVPMTASPSVPEPRVLALLGIGLLGMTIAIQRPTAKQ